MIKIILVTLLVFPSFSFAKVKYFYDKALPISAGGKIKIIDFDARLGGIYQVMSVGFPGEGYSYTRFKNLSKSINKLNRKAIVRSPASIVGKKFRLSKALETVLAPPVLPEKKK
ncbi:MAG: hypothetical protein ACRBBP_04405 [Bdellovibrionales bacterium]